MLGPMPYAHACLITAPTSLAKPHGVRPVLRHNPVHPRTASSHRPRAEAQYGRIWRSARRPPARQVEAPDKNVQNQFSLFENRSFPAQSIEGYTPFLSIYYLYTLGGSATRFPAGQLSCEIPRLVVRAVPLPNQRGPCSALPCPVPIPARPSRRAFFIRVISSFLYLLLQGDTGI